MSGGPEAGAASAELTRVSVFPLVRHLSARLTPWLMRTPLSANQVTAASLVAGLGAAACMALGGRSAALAGALLLILDYVLDNCDGEVARLKDQCSEFGDRFDSFADWVVHTAFFLGLGTGAARGADSTLWMWLGGIAAAGATINYGVALVLRAKADGSGADAQTAVDTAAEKDGHGSPRPSGVGQWVVFLFRELARADFCFIVLVLALFDAVWLLLPVAAVGAQVYWIAQFARSARDFHV